VGVGYKEEECPGYFRDGCDLFATKCQLCRKKFSDGSKRKGEILVSLQKPAFFCLGRDNYKCTHGYCNNCFWIKSSANEMKDGEQRRTSRRLRT